MFIRLPQFKGFRGRGATIREGALIRRKTVYAKLVELFILKTLEIGSDGKLLDFISLLHNPEF